MAATLPDPDTRSHTDVVIFDGECRFCQSQVKNLRRVDLRSSLSFISLHDARVRQRYPDLTYDDLMDQMYVVAKDGSRYGGAAAVRYLSRRLPLLWWLAPIMHIPGSLGLWRWIYRQIAIRRYKLAGRDCEGGTCSIHFGNPTTNTKTPSKSTTIPGSR